MKQTTILLDELIKDAELFLHNAQYAEGSIAHYRNSWRLILDYFRGEGIDHFSCDLCLTYIKKKYHITTNKKLTENQVFHIRTVKVLDEIAKNGKVKKCHQRSGKQVYSIYSNLLNNYLTELRKSKLLERTVNSKKIQLTRFLNFSLDYGIEEISSLTTECILLYIKDIKEFGYARSTRSGILFTLRSFLAYLYENELTKEPLQNLFPVIFSNKLDHIPSYYNEGELNIILSTVDRDSRIGKRDYLILILAIQLGIRAGDIRRLKYHHVHWDKNTIEFTQQKTGNSIQLPLTENIRYALIDYLRYSRPQSDEDNIFIRQRAPFEAYGSTNVFHYIISRYMKDAKINYSNRKHGLHSMRHSLASNLLKSNTPYPVITGVLGHENSSTTKVYLSIDLEQLRSVALEVPYEE